MNCRLLFLYVYVCVCKCVCVIGCVFVCNANDGFSGGVHQFVEVCVCVCVCKPSLFIQGVMLEF